MYNGRLRESSWRKTTVEQVRASGITADGLSSKQLPHVEDVEAKLLPSFDGDGRAWMVVAIANWAAM
jgi:hypothetical protein